MVKNRKISKAARQFRSLIQTNTPCYDTLVAYMESLGWVVIEYGDGGKGDKQLEALGVADYAEGVKAFFYISKAFRVIAVSALESKAERLDLLRHEIGHIILKHDPEHLTVKADAEASLFALYLQSEMHKPQRRWVPWAICAALAVFSLFSLAWGFSSKAAAPSVSTAATPQITVPQQTPSPQIEECIVYTTPSGDKYHRPTCGHIKGKETISMTAAKAKAAGYSPCKTCNP